MRTCNKRFLKQCIAAALALFVCFSAVRPVMAAEQSAWLTQGVYEIISVIDQNYALDISDASVADKANVQLWPRNGSQAQRFWIARSENSGLYYIKNVRSEKVIDAEMGGTASGTNLWQWRRNGSGAQLFRIIQKGNNTYELVNAGSGLAMDVSNGQVKKSANVQLWKRNGSPAQRWILRLVTPGTPPAESAKPDSGASSGQSGSGKSGSAQPSGAQGKKLVDASVLGRGLYELVSSIDTNYCVDIDNGTKERGGNAQLWPSNGSNAQKFYLRPNGGVYTIQNANSEMFLDAAGGGTKRGTNIWQWNGNGTAAQQFRIYDVGNGTYEIQCVANGLYLDVSNGVAKKKSNVQLWTGNGSPAQRWFIRGTTRVDVRNTIHETLKSAPSDQEIRGIGGYKPSQPVLDKLKSGIDNLRKQGYSAGFMMIDVATKQGVSYNPDVSIYAASTIKGCYVTSMVEARPALLNIEKGRIGNVLYWSSNGDYTNLRAQYGYAKLASYCRDVEVRENLSWNSWIMCTPRELIEIWNRMYQFFDTSATGDKLGDMFQSPNVSPIKEYQIKKGLRTRTKAGWIADTGIYHSASDAGIVYDNGKIYLVAILTSADGRMGLLRPIVEGLSMAIDEM